MPMPVVILLIFLLLLGYCRLPEYRKKIFIFLFPLLGFSFISGPNVTVHSVPTHNRKSKISKRSFSEWELRWRFVFLINIWAPLWFGPRLLRPRKKIVPGPPESWNILRRSNWSHNHDDSPRAEKLIKSEMAASWRHLAFHPGQRFVFIYLNHLISFLGCRRCHPPATFRQIDWSAGKKRKEIDEKKGLRALVWEEEANLLGNLFSNGIFVFFCRSTFE